MQFIVFYVCNTFLMNIDLYIAVQSCLYDQVSRSNAMRGLLEIEG